MDTTNRALMNVSRLDFPGLSERIGRRLAAAAMGTIRALRQWNRNLKTRRALLNMSDHMLKDIGISRVDALQEARKSFWQD